MKALGEKRQHTGTNGWGATSVTERQAFTVETSDVGQSRAHYLGMNHRTYTFKASDVGRIVEFITGGCWYFGSIFPDVKE
jgi:hypothetical protein